MKRLEELEILREAFGYNDDHLLEVLVRAMSDDEMHANFKWICRCYEIEMESEEND